jgi:L-lysine exporter family protein LysE/ArgO
VFLAVYGWRACAARGARSTCRRPAGAGRAAAAALAQAAAFTLLNPHVYLDTVLLVGSIGAQQPAALRGWFIAGAACQPGLVRAAGLRRALAGAVVCAAAAWQVLDGLIGVTMFVLSALLVRRALAGA